MVLFQTFKMQHQAQKCSILALVRKSQLDGQTKTSKEEPKHSSINEREQALNVGKECSLTISDYQTTIKKTFFLSSNL